MHKFIIKAKVNNNYMKEVDDFENQAKKFYNYGKTTFLSSDTGIEGRWETAYMHIVWDLFCVIQLGPEYRQIG